MAVPWEMALSFLGDTEVGQVVALPLQRVPPKGCILCLSISFNSLSHPFVVFSRGRFGRVPRFGGGALRGFTEGR